MAVRGLLPAAVPTPAAAEPPVITEFPFPAGLASAPLGISAGPRGTLWVTDAGRSVIDVFSVTGALVHSFPTNTPAATPVANTRGPDGNLRFVNQGDNSIYSVTTSGTFQRFGVPVAGARRPFSCRMQPPGFRLHLVTTMSGDIMGTAEVQGPLWGAAADDWTTIVEPCHVPFFEAALDSIGIKPGMRLLDVGCGAGLAMQLAHERGAAVTGLDAAEGLLAVARKRLPEADLRGGDIEELPFPDGTFEAVTAFNSVQFASDPTAALRQIKRVAKPGAAVAVATWGPVESCEMRFVLAALSSLLPPPPPGAAGPFALAAPGALEALVEGAGLDTVRTIDVPTPYIFPDLDTAVRGQLSSGPARMAIDRNGREAATSVLVAALGTFTQPDGSIRLDNTFKVVIART